MLLRGTYTFEPRPEDHDHTLSFTCNDNLVFLGVLKRDSNWIKVVDILGRIGYVPISFVAPDEQFLNRDLILTFLVDAVVKARQTDLPSASVLDALKDEIREYPSTVEKRSRELIKILRRQEENGAVARKSASEQTMAKYKFTRRENMSGNHELRRIGSDVDVRPRQTQRTPTTRNVRNSESLCGAGVDRENVSDSSVRTANDGGETGAETDARGDKKLPTSFSLQAIKSKLVNVVQETSGLGPKLSESLLLEVFQQIKASTSSAVPVESIVDKLSASTFQTDRTTSELEKAMKDLSKCCKDGIKENRFITPRGRHNRESAEFSEKLDKLRKLLIECDTFSVAQMLQADQHSFPQDLAHLYHLESPVNMKEKLLDIFLIICTIDRKVRKVLLSTTLPLYLAREIMAATGVGMKETRIFKQQTDLLVSLLTCGETMPETHFEIMGTGFVYFLLKEVENAFGKSCEWEYETMPGEFSAMINLLLAFNLQFAATHTNIVLKVLAERRKKPKGFIDIIIKLFRKASDPLRMELGDGDNPNKSISNNSVFKMLNEICLCQRTKAQLTAKDNEDLMDTIRDGILRNPAGNIRFSYIEVLRSLLESFSFCNNLRDIRTALLCVLLDNDPLAIPEQQLIRAISKEFPTLFMQSISKIRTNIEGAEGENLSDRDHQDECFYLSS